MTSTAIISIITLLKKVLSFIIGYRKEKHEAEYQEDLQEAKENLKESCDNGNLSDLINASKKLGETKKHD